MLFPTFTFAVFFLIVMPLSWLTMPKPHRWRLFIIAASYVFYGWWDPRYVFLLAASTLVNQAAAHAIHRAPDRRRAKLVLIAGLIFDVGLLAWFKYYDFFVTSGQQTLSTIGVGINPPLLQTVIPVGLSFYTFMAISYIVDVYRGDFVPVSLSRFAAFLSFFPHLVAGPIVRPSELIPQFDEPRDPRKLDSSRAFGLIVGGLFLKIVLATTCATLADKVFGAPSARSALETLVGIYAYAIQIFSDFAGYTFIAIGIALLLGFEFPQNFNSPYSADLAAGLLAALAHDALALAARLRLHPARRQPPGRVADLRQPDGDDADRRPVARGGVDVRVLGRPARHRAGLGALAPRARDRAAARSTRGWRGWPASTSSASPGCSSGRSRSATRSTSSAGSSPAGGSRRPASRSACWRRSPPAWRSSSCRGGPGASRSPASPRSRCRPRASHWP